MSPYLRNLSVTYTSVYFLTGQVMIEQGATIAATEALDFVKGLGNQGKEQTGKTQTKDLFPCLGLFCCISSYFCKFPDCMGCYMEYVALPLNWSCTCYKSMIQRGQVFTGDVFLCQSCRLGCMWPRTLCAYIGQCCWNDCRCAFPCDGMDTPCIVNICFINLCYKWRPTFHCTYFAPLAQFDDDYKGDKYTVCDMVCFACKVVCNVISYCSKGKSDEKKQDEDINATAVPDNSKL